MAPGETTYFYAEEVGHLQVFGGGSHARTARFTGSEICDSRRGCDR